MPTNLDWSRLSLGSRFIAGTWITVLTALVVTSIVLELRWSTSALLLVMWVAPVGVMLLLGWGGASPLSTHQMLYAVEQAKGGRA
jgi:hypothetical protein